MNLAQKYKIKSSDRRHFRKKHKRKPFFTPIYEFFRHKSFMSPLKNAAKDGHPDSFSQLCSRLTKKRTYESITHRTGACRHRALQPSH